MPLILPLVMRVKPKIYIPCALLRIQFYGYATRIVEVFTSLWSRRTGTIHSVF
jgi:hypothetical protein